MKYLIFSILLFLSGGYFSFSQTPKAFPSIESPNSATLKSSVESPVTLNTGKTGISIPIYMLKEKDINVPIMLSYDASGVKVDLHPGWVGQNWQLQAGGSVTRNIRGVPDELYWRNDFALTAGGQNQASNIIPFGYMYTHSINDTTIWDSYQRITELAKNGMEPGNAWVEAEPDEFVFTCGNYSGRFYLDHDGFIRVQSQPDIKVEGEVFVNVPMFDASLPLNVNDPTTYTSFNIATYNEGYPIYSYNRVYRAILMGFRITTPDGIQYEYGMWGQDDAINNTFDEAEFSSGIFEQYLLNETFTAWHLKRIKAPDGETVEFVYERGSPILQMGRVFSFYKSGGTASPKGFLGFIFGGVSSYTSEPKEEMAGSFIRSTYLKKIISKTTEIDFYTSETNELNYSFAGLLYDILDRSRFYDPNYHSLYFGRAMIGTSYPNPNPYVLTPGITYWGNNEYSVIRHDGMIEDLYFNDLKWRKLDSIKISTRDTVNSSVVDSWGFSYNNNSSERLQLLSLQQKGKGSGITMPPYVFSYDTSATLPGYNSMLIDHWGYFNNRFVQVDIDQDTTLINYKSLREPVSQYMYAGSLRKVTLPSGGIKHFVYEPNKYKMVVKRNTGTGAFYIDSLMSEKVGAGLRIKQIWEEPGGGIPEVTTTYSYGDGLLLGDVQYYWPNYKGRLLNGNEYTSLRFVTESLLPVCEQPGGGLVTYDQVMEQQPGNGKIIREYLGFKSSPDLQGNSIDAEKSPYSPFTSKSIERGLLKEIRYFDQSDSLLSLESYDYLANPGFNNDYIRAVYSKGTALFGSTEVNVIEGTAYKHFLYPYQTVKKTVKTFDRNRDKYLETSQYFTYNTQSSPYNDNRLKESLEVNSKGDSIKTLYKHPIDYTGTAVYDSMVRKNMLINIIEQSKYKNSTFLHLNKVNFNFISNGYWAPNANALYLPQTEEEKILTGSTEVRIRYDEYDSEGNLTGASRDSDVKVAYVWDYKNRLPIAQVVNAPVSDVAYTSFESDGKGNWTYSGIPITYPYAHTGKKIYNLSSGNIYKPIHTANTYIISYWRPVSASALSIPGTITGYPISGRTVNGWKYYEHKVSGQSIAVIMGKGNIDELRLYPAGAQMTTYTYEPLIGMTSQSDVNNHVTYYEYDGLGRLSLVRDQDKNVLKRICYNYAGQPEDCNNSPAQGTIPLPPGNLTAIAFSSSAIKVAWANNAANATGIELYRSYNGNTDYVLLDRLSPDTYSYNDTALQIGTLFYYKVRAVGEEGSSGYSNEASARTFGVIPNLLPIENIYMRFNSTVVLPIEATASSPVDITLQADNLPGFAVFQQTGNGTGTITFTPSQSEQGVYSGIKITAANPQNNTFSTQFDLTVNSNYVPVIDSISDVTMNEKDSIQVQLSAADQDSSDVLMWSYSGLPSFATAASTNRTAKITFKPSYGQEGTYRVKLYVNDGRNGKDSSAFIITVIHADNPNPDDGTIPVSPKDLAGQFIDSSGTVQLTWTNAAYNARRNEVYRSTYMTGGYSLLNPGDTTNKDSTSYIDSTVTGNTTYFYLVRAVNNSGGASSLVIKITTPSKKPVIHDIDDIYIERDSAKNINIIATDDPGDIITLLFHDLPGFASFTENGNGSGVLSISAVNTASGGYPITISAIDNYGAFSQKTINIIVTDKDTSRFYINFNNKDYPVTGSLWNSFNAIQTGGTPVSANTTLSNLKDDSGKPTLLSVRLLNLWPQNYLGAVTGNNSGVFPDAVIATGYYFYVQASAPQKTIRLSGLKANSKYDLIFYGNRAFSTDQVTRYTIGTQTVTLNSRNNTSNTTQIAGLSANGQGEIDIVVDAVMGKYAVINAMVIKEYPGN